LDDAAIATPSLTAPSVSGTDSVAFELEVCDGLLCDTDGVTVTIVGNQPPVAVAGSDQTVDEGATVALDGSGSYDPDSGPGPLTFAWTQTSGLAVTLAGAATATPSFDAPLLWSGDEVLGFQLEVCDGAACSQDSVDVTVTDSTPNVAPVADAGPDQTVDEGDAVQLDASASYDPDGGPNALSFSWTQTSGPSVTLNNSASATPSFTAPSVSFTQTAVFSVQICDGLDCTTDSVSVTIEPTSTGNVVGEIVIVNDWGSGYCADVTIRNNGSATITNWQIVFDVNESSVYSLWNANYSVSGSVYTAGPVSWNGTIAPGGSQTWGFCANITGSNYQPTVISTSGS
jgi:hypothetical protein